MKKIRLSHRILAMVLVVLMTVQLLPLNAFAFGALQSWDPGVDLSTLKQDDAINWPIKVYDYLSDGMLFEWFDTNTTTNSSSPNVPVGSTDGPSYIAPYGGGEFPVVTKLGSDFTYDGKESGWTTDTYKNAKDSSGNYYRHYSSYYYYYNNSYGKSYTMTKMPAADYSSPMYLRLTDGSVDAWNWPATYFSTAQSTTGNARYMVLVYRASGVTGTSFGIGLSDAPSSYSFWSRNYTEIKDSADWTYTIIDLYSLSGSVSGIKHVWFNLLNSKTTGTYADAKSRVGMKSGAFLDLTHIGFFGDTVEANNYGEAALKFIKNPGEYLAHQSTTTYTHSYTKLPSKADYLNNIFTLNYRWQKENVDPALYPHSSSANYPNTRYGMDFTTHSLDNGWKTNAYTSDTFWTWSNGTTMALKNTVNNVTRTEGFSMSNINVEQHTQTNGAQFVRLTNSGPSKILLSKFREDHQTAAEGYVPLTSDVNYMVMVYRANGLETGDRYGLWAHGYLDSSSPDGHKTANYWKYAGLTNNADWTRAGNINQQSFGTGSGWQYAVIDITETIGKGDAGMVSIDRLANLGMYLPALTDGKSLDIAYVGYFRAASEGVEDEKTLANEFGQNAVNYMNAAATVVQDVNTSKTYASTRRWHGGGNKSFGMLYSSGGGYFLPSGNSGGTTTSTDQYDYGYQFDTWMIGYRTNAVSTDSFNQARYNLVFNEETGTYEKVKYTANYTSSSSKTFLADASGTTNNIYFMAAGYGTGSTNGVNDPFNTSSVPFDGYQLLQTMTAGVMTAGLLEGGLQTITVDGVQYRVPVYRQETVEYIAYNLLHGLRVPMKDSSGNYNTRYIKGSESTKYGGVDLNGDGMIGWINYDGDSRNGNELNEASVDLATALRHELGLSPRLGNSVNVMSGDSGVDASYATLSKQMGTYKDTLAKSQMLYGEFSDCRNAIDTAMDAAYYLLNNIFISNSYNQQQDDYDYLTLSSATVNALGHSGYAYVFDAGFTTGMTATYDTTFTDDGTNKSAILYSPYGSEGGTGTISMEGVTGKTRFDYSTSTTSFNWTTRFPFLPITDAEGDFAGRTKSYYFMDDAQRVYTEGSNSYKDRNFNYVIASNGEFVYREEDDLFFEFEGDDDVYLFINGELVLDIGGAHSITSVYIDVNDYVNAAATALSGLAQYGYNKDMSIDQFDEWISAAQLQRLDSDFNPTGESVTNPFSAEQIATYKRQHRLNLSDGQICQFDFYYMERHGWGANMRIVTNMHITDPALSVDKQAYQFGEEIEYGGVIDPTSSVEYNFTLTNTGNTKLYNLTWKDDVLGITMDPTNGLVVGKNTEGLDMNGIYVMNAAGGYLQPKDMTAIVSGTDASGNLSEFRVTFEEVNGDGGQEAFKKFLKKLESDDGTSSGFDDAEVTNAGSGLWVGASVRFCGIYYMLTPDQTDAGLVDNTVYLTATTRIDPATVGNRTLRSDASHRLYTNGFPIHYQWAGHNIFMNLEHLLKEAKEEADRAGSQLSLYQEFFKNASLDGIYTQPCDKFGRVGGDYTEFLNAYSDGAGHSGYLINYKEPGIYTFHLLMYMKSGKDAAGNTKTFASSGVNASDIKEGYYAILRSQVFVADVEDSVYVLDYGLSTESLDANGALFKNDYLFGPYGTIRAKLMGITGSQPSFIDPALNTDATKTGINFATVTGNRINTPNGFYNANLAIPEGGKDIAYDSNKGEYTLTGVGTMKISAVLPTDGNWDMPYLYYWYDDGTTGPSWPGTPLKDLGGAGKFELDIPADVTNVIINNGSAALKTADISITPGLEATITVSVNNNNQVTHHVDTIIEEVTMHVKVPEDWGKVYLHHWHDDGESTEFPGDELTEMDENGYYIINVHGDVANLLIANGEGKQTGDLTVYAGKEAWIEVSDTVTGTVDNDDGSVTSYYDAKVKYTLSEGFQVHASVPVSWKDTVYLYYWRTDGSENAPWPGTAMTKGEMWYTYPEMVPADVNQIIINDGDDGGNHQTVNLTVTPGLETWIMVQNEVVTEGEGVGKYTAKVAYGSESSNTGLTFTPKTFLDQENNMWMAITVHGTNSNHSALNTDIDIHNETQMFKKITVLPATVVYYEDTFGSIEYADEGTTGNSFVHHGNGSGLLSQSIDQNQIYGQDSTYQDSDNELYSGDSLTAVQIVDKSKFASFTFKGTGFELVGRTNAFDAGNLMARVYKKANYSPTAYDDYMVAANAYRKQSSVFGYYSYALEAYQEAVTAYDTSSKAYDELSAAYTAAVKARNEAAALIDAVDSTKTDWIAAQKAEGAAQQAMLDAETAMYEAVNTLAEAAIAKEEAKTARDEAFAAFQAASEGDENYAALEAAYLAAEKVYTDCEAAHLAAEQDESNAYQAYLDAEQTYENAQAASAEAEEAFNNAEQSAETAMMDQYVGHEDAIINVAIARENVAAAKAAMDEAEAAMDEAYADLEAAKDQPASILKSAEEAYTAAQKAYAESVGAYEEAVEALDEAKLAAIEVNDAYVAAFQTYLEKGNAAYDAFKAYGKCCHDYNVTLTNYKTAVEALQGKTIDLPGVVGTAVYEKVTVLQEPSEMFAFEACAEPTAPAAFGIEEIDEPASPFVYVAPVFTQFDHGNDGGAETINQVPVIRITGMELDEYVVELAGMPIYTFDPNNNYEINGVEETYVYIDGLRIFQPMGATNNHYINIENGAQINELRDLIAAGKIAVGVLEDGALKVSSGTNTWTEGFFDNDFSADSEETFESIKVDSTGDYIIQGPNNEVYMEGNASTSAMIFYVRELEAAAHELQIAVRALDYGKYYGAGSSALNTQLQYGILMADGTYAWKNLVRVVSGTEQYYTIPYTECPVDTQGRYQVVLRAINPQTGANALVSYSNVKLNGLEIVKMDDVGEGTILYYQNGILVKPQYELVIIADSSFVPVEVIPFTGSELTMKLDREWTYVYVRSTFNGETYDFFAKEDPGQVGAATLWRYDDNFGDYSRWTFDIKKGDKDEITLKIKQTVTGSLELSYCIHSFGEGEVTREPNCSIPGIKAYTCSACGFIKREELPTNDEHQYSGGVCVRCGDQEDKYYLVGYINGKNYGCEQDYMNMGEYLFVDGKLNVHFEKDSYVYLKADGNKAWYMVPAYVTADTATFYDTTLGEYTEKMYVPCGVDLVMTLTVNEDGSLTLHYEEPCKHTWDDGVVTKKPACTEDGEKTYTCSKCYDTKKEMVPATGHNYVNGICSNSGCGDIEYKTIYFKNTDGWENVYLYAWSNGQTYTAAWPGDPMTPVEGESGIYSITVPSYLEIIFNNGDAIQTDDMTIPSYGDMYVYSDNVWVNHSGKVDYYLVGSINGVDYGCGDNANNMGIYQFVDGKLSVTFDKESYVYIKTTGNAAWYMTQTYCDTFSATLYNTTTGASEKMFVPAGAKIDFILTVNDDDTLSLVAHSWGGVVTKQPTCTEDGEKTYTCYLCNDSYKESVPATGHSFDENDTCTVCGTVDTRIVYFKNTAGWENVYIYAFTEGTPATEYTGVWPGAQMSLVEGETDLYYYVLSAQAKSVIFNNGSGGAGNQTDNLHAPSDENNKYTYGANVWTPVDEDVEIVVPQVEKLYLQPGDWNVDNAWFAAYFFGNGDAWLKMTDDDGDGIFECEKLADYTNVIFCRMNKDMTDLGWDSKWNQTVDLTIPTDGKNFFTITNPWNGTDGKGDGEWSTYVCDHSYGEAVTTEPGCETAGVKTFTCSKCGDSYTEEIASIGHNYVDGSCTNCGGKDPAYIDKVYLQPGAEWMQGGAWFAAWFPGAEAWVTMTDVHGNGYYQCEIPEGATGVIFVRMNPEATAPSWNDGEKWNQTVDLSIEANRLFVIENPWNEASEWKATGSWTDYDATVAECEHAYAEEITTAATCTSAGVKTFTCSKCSTSYTETIAATGHSYVDGTCGNCGAAEPTEPVVLYLQPSSSWNEGSARFAAYFFGNGETWLDMTDEDGDGIYEVVAPTGYPNVIFCRMNPGTTENNWDNKWNQTGDLVVPTGDATMCTIPDGNWNPAATDVTWSAYTSSYSLRSTRKVAAFVLPDMYISGDEDNVLNLPSVSDQLASDVVFGELEEFVPGETEPEIGDVVINSAAPVLSDDINMNYYVTVPEDAENVYMTFGFGDKITLVTDYTVTENGRYCFTFTGINAQRMGDNIRATLYATVDGQEVSDCVAEYSIRTYCANTLAKTTDEKIITMISDLLVYGAKMQVFMDYNPDRLVTEGLELTPSTFTALDSSYDKLTVTGTADEAVRYSAATLKLSNKVILRLTVLTEDPSAYSYTVSANGVDTVYTGEDLVEVSDGVYYLYYDQLKATAFDSVVTATIQRDGQTISQTVTYSVNTYIYRNQTTENVAMRELLEAIFNYGRSAASMVN